MDDYLSIFIVDLREGLVLGYSGFNLDYFLLTCCFISCLMDGGRIDDFLCLCSSLLRGGS